MPFRVPVNPSFSVRIGLQKLWRGNERDRGSPFGRSRQWKKYPITLSPPALTYLGQNCVWSFRWRRERKRSSQNPQTNGKVTPVPLTPSRKVLIVTTLLPLLTLRFVI